MFIPSNNHTAFLQECSVDLMKIHQNMLLLYTYIDIPDTSLNNGTGTVTPSVTSLRNSSTNDNPCIWTCSILHHIHNQPFLPFILTIQPWYWLIGNVHTRDGLQHRSTADHQKERKKIKWINSYRSAAWLSNTEGGKCAYSRHSRGGVGARVTQTGDKV